jgi:hypothetical protein
MPEQSSLRFWPPSKGASNSRHYFLILFTSFDKRFFFDKAISAEDILEFYQLAL